MMLAHPFSDRLVLKTICIYSFVFFLSLTILFSVNAQAQEIPAKLRKAISALDTLQNKAPVEKAYLHLDKPYYATGDTIWFKAYVTIGKNHQLSALSGALYAELFDEANTVVQSLKLPLVAGMAKGNFILKDSLEEGNYRIRAYTRWMRNAGADYFFDKTFRVGNSISNKIFTKVTYQYSGQKITAILNYLDVNGSPYAGKEVSYEVKTNTAKLSDGKGQTDQQGNLTILLNNDKPGKFKGAQILTTIEADAGNKTEKGFPLKEAFDQPDMQFFPESGQLVTGIRSKVAFKATGIDGLGLAVKGLVTDNDNKEVSSFEAQHLGMGFFNLLPESGKTYKAKITYPDGSENTLNLPVAIDKGYVLAVYNNFDSDSVLVRINASPAILQAGPEELSLVGQSAGSVVLTTAAKIDKPITSVWITKSTFPSGIAQFTLFGANGDPINERITFMRNPDQLQVKLNTASPSYGPRKQVAVDVAVLDKNGAPSAGSFSVAVIDETKAPIDEIAEQTILSNVLLSSDIKGYIEKPNYYFTNVNEEVHSNLELLMMTQGFRRFSWKELIVGTIPKPEFKPEKIFTQISGTLKTLGGKPVANGKINLLSTAGNIFLDTLTDAQGKFIFPGLVLADSMKFTIQGKTAKNGSNVEVVMDEVPEQIVTANKNIGDIDLNIHNSMSDYLANSKTQFDDLLMHDLSRRNISLNTVTITGNKSTARAGSRADYLLGAELFSNCPTLLDCIQGRLPGIAFRPGVDNLMMPYSAGGNTAPMQLVVDGILIDMEDGTGIRDFLTATSPDDIKSIEIFRNIPGMALYGKRGENGVLEFHTKKGVGRVAYKPNIALYAPKGFNNVKEFFTPKYTGPKVDGKASDLRTTIYWNPGVLADKDGTAKLEFFNADSKGSYRVVIEGINGDGQLGRQVYHYKVE